VGKSVDKKSHCPRAPFVWPSIHCLPPSCVVFLDILSPIEGVILRVSLRCYSSHSGEAAYLKFPFACSLFLCFQHQRLTESGCFFSKYRRFSAVQPVLGSKRRFLKYIGRNSALIRLLSGIFPPDVYFSGH